MLQVQERDLFVQDLGKDINANILLASLAELDVLLAEGLILSLVQHDLRKDLVREGARHNEGGVASCAAKVDETAFSEEDDVTTGGHEVTVDLGLDVLNGFGTLLQPSDVDFDIEVADVYCQLEGFHALEICTYCRR